MHRQAQGEIPLEADSIRASAVFVKLAVGFTHRQALVNKKVAWRGVIESGYNN
jgi:hypothetical protein